jgi:hypothetical protein
MLFAMYCATVLFPHPAGPVINQIWRFSVLGCLATFEVTFDIACVIAAAVESGRREEVVGAEEEAMDDNIIVFWDELLCLSIMDCIFSTRP